MKQTATLVFELEGKDIINRATVASLMTMIAVSLDKWPLPNIKHWELKSFVKAK